MDVAPLRAYTWALLLGLFVPVSWILDLILGPGVIVFAVAGLAIIPLAWFLGLATEELGKHAGPGVGGLLNQVRALAWDPHQWQLIVVCGRNERLRGHLSRLRYATPTLVLGFIDNMPELMRASDVAVTKAGPGAIVEALATGLPLIITGYLPGQETPNVDFVVGSGFGMYAPRVDDIVEEVRVLAEGGPTWQSMSRRAREFSHPYASQDIARECLLLAGRYRASAQASL